MPFTIDLTALKARKAISTPINMGGIYERIWKGSLPGYVSGKFTDRNVFYSSHLQTYIDRDVSELISLADKLQFQDFIRAAACRSGQMLNIHDITRDVGVSDDTARHYTSFCFSTYRSCSGRKSRQPETASQWSWQPIRRRAPYESKFPKDS